MRHGRARDGHQVVFHDRAAPRDLVRMDERRQRRAALVAHAHGDVGRAHVEKLLRHARQRRRSPRIHRRRQPVAPREQQQVAVVGVVIRMMVRDEDVPERPEHARDRHLTRDAVAAVDHVAAIADDDDLGWTGACGLWCRPACRAEQDEPRGPCVGWQQGRQGG
jgi:hypothetical protein